jgi:hypothetical protein
MWYIHDHIVLKRLGDVVAISSPTPTLTLEKGRAPIFRSHQQPRPPTLPTVERKLPYRQLQ